MISLSYLCFCFKRFWRISGTWARLVARLLKNSEVQAKLWIFTSIIPLVIETVLIRDSFVFFFFLFFRGQGNLLLNKNIASSRRTSTSDSYFWESHRTVGTWGKPHMLQINYRVCCALENNISACLLSWSAKFSTLFSNRTFLRTLKIIFNSNNYAKRKSRRFSKDFWSAEIMNISDMKNIAVGSQWSAHILRAGVCCTSRK